MSEQHANSDAQGRKFAQSEEHAQNVRDAHGDQEHHIVSPFIYLGILLALLVFTGLTVWASFIDLGEWHIAQGITLFWNPVVALAIACTKMTLVVLFFMHVKYSPRLTKLTVASGLITFLVLVGMTLADYFTRAWGRW
jgi:cytochrome c oxidase subunit IV